MIIYLIGCLIAYALFKAQTKHDRLDDNEVSSYKFTLFILTALSFIGVLIIISGMIVSNILYNDK